MSESQARRRAAGVIRVSKVGKRQIEKFISPEDQLKQINELCTVHNFDLTQLYYEIDQSGYRTKFEKRKGLYPATQMIENGDADVVVMAFFDRMARNIVVQTEFLGRIGRAGGEVWAHDFGQIQTDTAVNMLATGMLGLVAMYTAQSTAEKTQGPKERAISMGIPTFPWIPAGYRLDARHLEVYEPEAKLIREAFERRDGGASYREIRDWLRSEGLVRSIRGVQDLLKNRIYLGELRFGLDKRKGGMGVLENLNSHTPIIEDRDLFERVVNMRVVKGPRGDRESVHARLLSRQGVLRCFKCNRAMITEHHLSHGNDYVIYRCPPMGDCPQRVSVSARKVDAYIEEYMTQIQQEGSAHSDTQLVQAQAELARAQADFKQAMRNLATMKDTVEAQEVLEEFRQKSAAAQERVNDLRRAFGPAAVRSMKDWADLTLNGRRQIVRALIKRIQVFPGEGNGSGPVERRLRIETFEQ